MADTIFITANWRTGALSQQTISMQYDNNRYAVQFVGYPEASDDNELDYYLLVWMSSAPGEKPDEIAPIQLTSDQWYISNVFTQQTQQIKFQMCALNTEGTFEAHSPIFTGFVRNSLEHDGATQDIDVSTLFDAYREYLNELIIRADAVVIDPVPTQGSTNAVSSGGVYEALHNTDTTLSQSGQAADAKVVGDEISDLKEDLKSALNGIPYDIVLLSGGIKQHTHNGVTFAPKDNGTGCTVNGTASNNAFDNVYFNLSALPEGVKPGDKLRFYVTTTKPSTLRCVVMFFDSSETEIDQTQYIQKNREVTIPSNAVGMVIRIQVQKNAIMSNDTISLNIYPDIYDLDNWSEFKSRIEPTIINGYMYTGTNADSININSWYFCNGDTVSNCPNTYHAFWLLTLKASETETGKTRIQVAIDWTTGEIYSRRSNYSGEFTAWNKSNPLSLGTKYVAFGDSVTKGAVWTDTSMFTANIKYQIPTRIAKAIGMYDNYSNEAVGGTGYLNPGTDITITQRILNYDFSDVEVITIAGGVNDKPDYQLGTSNSVSGDGTICGAIKQIIDYMASNYPRVQIIIIQPTPSGHLSDPWNGTLGGGWSLNDFNREVGALCEKEHVAYVTLTESVYCKQWDIFSGGSGTGTKPNFSHFKDETDYGKFGDFVAGKVSSFFHGNN